MLHWLFSSATHTHTHGEYFIVSSEVKGIQVQPETEETSRVTESTREFGTKRKVISGREDKVGRRVMRKEEGGRKKSKHTIKE